MQTRSFIFDCGTGIIPCGEDSIKRGEKIFHIFLSHMHYDHIIGLTKFTPLFRNDCQIHFYGHDKEKIKIEDILKQLFRPPFFPIDYKNLPALNNIKFHCLNEKKVIKVGNNLIEIYELNHPQASYAYRIWSSDKKLSVVYATDHEHGNKTFDGGLIKFVKNSDLFIYDSTYSESVYHNYLGWGHSTAAMGAFISKQANVKLYAIFHHDPSSSDSYLERVILPEAKKIFPKSFLSREKDIIKITSRNQY